MLFDPCMYKSLSGGETSFSKDCVACGRCALNGFNHLDIVSTVVAGSGPAILFFRKICSRGNQF